MPDIWMPEQARQTREATKRRVVQEWLSENADELEELMKSFAGESPLARIPRKILPAGAALGLYRGVRDPSAALKRSEQFLQQLGTVHAVRMVIDQRILQTVPFCIPASSRLEPGFQIVMNQADERPSMGDQKRMELITARLMRGGLVRELPDGTVGVASGDGYSRGWSLMNFVTALLRDSLTLDRAGVFVNPSTDPRRPPGYWEPLDALLLRKTLPPLPPHLLGTLAGAYQPYQPKLRPGERIAWVMLKPDASLADETGVLREFTEEECAVWIRWPRTSWWSVDYGFSELESLVEVIVGLVQSVGFNISMFATNAVPPALIEMTGNFSEEWMTDFLYTLVTNCSGPGNWHKLPVIIGDADSRINVHPLRGFQGQDMQWREFLILCLNLLCAGFHMAAEEVNFQAFLTRGGQLTGEGGAERIAYAQEVGLRGLLRSLEAFLNEAIVWRFWPDPETGIGPYSLRFTGLKRGDEDAVQRRWAEAVSGGLKTLNEVRAEGDSPPYRDPEDRDLWQKIERRALEKYPFLRNDPRRLDDIVCGMYQDRGGRLRDWPDLPLSMMALQARSSEMQQGGSAGVGGAGGGADLAALMGGAGGLPPDRSAKTPESGETIRKSLLHRAREWWARRRGADELEQPEVWDVYFERER